MNTVVLRSGENEISLVPTNTINSVDDPKEIKIKIIQAASTNIRITVVNAGSPGIIGPDISFNLDDIVEMMIEKAKKQAYGWEKLS